MVNHEEHIRKMQAEGLISDRQADLLRGAVQGAEPVTSVASHSAQHLLPILIIVLAVILAIFFSISGSEPEAIQDISQTLNQQGSTGSMNRTLNTSLSIALILIVPLLAIAWLYNGIVGKEEKTMESWAQVEASYQRRADLIPALVETVSKYMKHEQNTLTQITGMRAANTPNPEPEINQLLKAQSQAAELLRSHVGKTPTDAAQLASLTESQTSVGKSVRQLLAIAESYPQLRASDQFLELQAQFEGTENRILTARNRFNEAVEEYNGTIRKLPGSLIAGIGHFQRKAYFRADDGSHAPERNWN